MRRKNLRRIVLAVAVVLLLAVPVSLQAQQRSGFGIGVMLGEPTGLAAITWLGGGNAVDLVAAWSFRGAGSIYLHADYQFHSFISDPMTFYAGLGGFVILRDDPDLGIRVPLGITYLFREAPIDVFLEVAPGLSIVPATSFNVHGGIGFRFYP